MEQVHHAVGDEAGDHDPAVAPESPGGYRREEGEDQELRDKAPTATRL